MIDRFHLVQICNVGTLTGGTGACTRTIQQALPDWRHTLLCFSHVSDEMRERFRPAELHQISRLTSDRLHTLNPDFLIFHNTRRSRVEDDCFRWPAIYYQHSTGPRWREIPTVCCSRWLAEHGRGPDKVPVLYQAVPRPVRMQTDHRRSRLSRDITIGRLCTPTSRKWPRELIPFYQELAGRHATARWEFVGCPESLQEDLRLAVNRRATFHPASWYARGHFWNWDVSLYHHPSLAESFGRTVAEALRCGCIPIVDHRGGFREQLPSGTGYLCDSVAEFSRAIEEVRDPAERMRRSRRCRAHADDRFSLGVFRQRLLDVMRTVMR